MEADCLNIVFTTHTSTLNIVNDTEHHTQKCKSKES